MIQMSFFLRPFQIYIMTALPAIFCGEALAFTALQFDATASRSVSRTDGSVTAWVSTRGGVVANPCHTNGAGWASPQYDGRGVIGFLPATGTAAPISFPLTETGLVSRAFIVAEGTAATFCSTLLDAPCPLRLFSEDEDGEVLDRMWIVVNSRIAKSEFNDWYDDNADTSWVNTLPKPYAKLQISSSWVWGDSATPVNPLNPDPWDSPSKLSGYLHHDSAWEMRAESATSSHGNQACYDANGDIVLNGIGGGTADYAAGNWKYVDSHIREDVNPYLHASHLDGNPGDTKWNNGISRPCLYQGDYLDKYIERRPITHPEGE